MTTTTQPPDWLTVGAKVAIVRSRDQSVRFGTVERFTPTTVVIDGNRYPLHSLKRNLGTWDGTAEVKATDDPTLEPLLYVQARDQAVRKLEHALQVWRRDSRWSTARGVAVREAVAALAPYHPEDSQP